MLCYGVFIASAQAALTDAVATLLRASIATARDTADANDHLLNSANRTIATMHDATPTPLFFLEGELARFVESGAWEFGTSRKWVSRLILVSKPACINQWRCIIDLRVLNFYCVRKRLKKSSYWECATSPRRESDYMFSFDLQDGFCALGIAEADRDYFTVDVRGQLYMFASLPMGWSLSPYYFVTLTQLIGRATRNAWWLPVRELQTLAEQAQYLFLAIPVARFFLLELHSVVGDRRGGRVRTTPQLGCDLQCWTSVPGQYNGKLIHLPVETAYLHTAMSFYGCMKQCFRSCEEEQRPAMAAYPGTTARYVTWLGNMGTIKASILQPYVSAVNNFFEEHGREPRALGDLVGPAASQMTLQSELLRAPLLPVWS
eukprot:jgi/Tetstr1/433745/TSEL_022964.t1